MKLDTSPGRFHKCFPHELRERDQWCLHDAEKKPLQVSCFSREQRRGARAGDRSTWHGFLDARREAYRCDLGLGFQLSEDDPYVVLDLDHVRDPATGAIVAKWAEKLLARFDTLTYMSVSGSGVHVWCKMPDQLPGPGVQCPLPQGTGIDIFDRKRYLAMSGHIVNRAPIRDYSADVLDVYLWARRKNEQRKAASRAKQRKRRASGKKFSELHIRSRSGKSDLTLEDWLVKEGISHFRIDRGDGVIRYGLPECPWESGHTTKSKPGDAVVYVNSYGAWGFDCFHTHCEPYEWADFKNRVVGGS